MRKREAKIENWAAVRSAQYPSFEELQPGVHLVGYTMRHPNLPDLSLVYTSRVVSVDNGNGVVETSNTLYRLGQPDETYRAWQLEAPDSKSLTAEADSTLKEQHPQKSAA
jgi:hypothetical protein